MWPNVGFAAAAAAKYLISQRNTSEQLGLALCYGLRHANLSPRRYFISFSGMATFNKLGGTITPSPSAIAAAQGFHSWEGVQCLVGKAACISGG